MIQKSRGEAQRLKFVPSLLLFTEIHGDSHVFSVPMIHQCKHHVSVVKRQEVL